jgi:phage gpG-like protein
MQISIKTDTMTPHLQKLLAKVKNPSPVMREIGDSLVTLTKQAFTNPALRPATWPGNATLVRSGTLSRSPRTISSGATHALIGSDREYAAAHQLGSKPHVIRPKNKKALFWKGAAHPVREVNHPGLPPRPFFPFSAAGEATASAKLRVKEILLRWLNK